ncbi:hypothetical protein ACFLVS_05915 [Chloroflexota bacterium]
MKESKKRTLYECAHARVNGDRIRCRKGHPLLVRTEDNGIDVKRLARGEPLTYNICQKCPDYDCMGPPVLAEERGWLKKKETK